MLSTKENVAINRIDAAVPSNTPPCLYRRADLNKGLAIRNMFGILIHPATWYASVIVSGFPNAGESPSVLVSLDGTY
jgi:hypothetical protein